MITDTIGITVLLSQHGSLLKSADKQHHDRGETHFWELENVGCPNTGWGYFVVFFIALVPYSSIWHWYMRKRLAAWDEHFATDEERAIAKESTKK